MLMFCMQFSKCTICFIFSQCKFEFALDMNLSKKFLIEIFWNNVYFQHSTNSTTMSDYFMNRKSGNGLVAPWRAFSQPLGQIFDLCSWPQSKVSLRAQSMQYAAAPITKLENCCNCSKSKILGPKAIFTLLQMVSKLGEDNFTKVEKLSRNIADLSLKSFSHFF